MSHLISNLILTSPSLTVPGHNEGLNNFVPDGIDLSTFTPENVLCFLGANLVDVAPGDFSPALTNQVAVVSAFIAGKLNDVNIFSSYG
jgi:hypothetical protein